MLDRSAFVGRLVDALIDPRSRRSTGVVVGVTGPWGAGKSSILNLLETEIQTRYRSALVVRFDPWLVAGRDALVGMFIRDLLAAMRERSEDDTWHDAARALRDYADIVSPLTEMLPFGLSAVARVLGRIIGRTPASDQTLDELKARLANQLDRVRSPIVVLIDELDRVEDDEVRTVAQLIRSIVDFPRVSYLVGYDHDRVVDALGAHVRGSRSQRLDRGRAYLEKIVQVAIPLPSALRDELKLLFRSDLLRTGNINNEVLSSERYLLMEENILDSAIFTPRDAKRVAGTFQVLYPMTAGEVDAIDLIGYCALAHKAPSTVEGIKRNPEAVLDDPGELAFLIRPDHGAGAQSIFALGEYSEALGSLANMLFPALEGRRRRADEYGDPISKRRSLFVVQRLGLGSSEVSKAELDRLVGGQPHHFQAELRRIEEAGRLNAYVDRLIDTYVERSPDQQVNIWLGLEEFFRVKEHEDPDHFIARRSHAEEFARAIYTRVDVSESARARSQEIFSKMAFQHDVVFIPNWLRRHFFMHGIYVNRTDGADRAFLDREQTESWSKTLVDYWRLEHLAGRLLPRLREFHAIYAINDLDYWGSDCRAAFSDAVADDEILDRVVLICFGQNYMTDKSTIDKLCGLERFQERVSERFSALEDGARPNAALIQAYQRARGRDVF